MAGIQALCPTVKVKRELSQKSADVPTFTDGHEL